MPLFNPPPTSGAGSGTVTSVDVAAPAPLTASGGPVTASGTVTLSWAGSQTANRVLASPNGSSGAVGLRALVAGDVPAVNPSALTGSGTVPLAALSGLTTSQLDAAAGILSAQIAALATSKLTGTLTAAQIASVNPSALTGTGTVPTAGLPAATTAAQGAVQLASALPGPDTRAGAAGSAVTAAPGDHAHPANGGLWLPADMGWLAMNTDPWIAASNISAVVGALWLFKVLLPAQISVTNALVRVQTVGSSLATCYAGVYSSAGALVGGSADQSSAWSSSTGLKTMALTGGPYSCGPGFVWVGLLQGAGSGLKFSTVSSSGDTSLINGALATSALRAATYGSSQTSLPGPLTLGSLGSLNGQVWVALS